MKEPEFNLLDEKWIRVRRPDCVVEEVSLKEVFQNAQSYEDLAGETAAQDVAILRLLLAVLHCVFSRVDEHGNSEPLVDMEEEEQEEEVFRRWQALWNLGHFPENIVNLYLEHWRERFWLFHEERPFWQVANLKELISEQQKDKKSKKDSMYPAHKLNGEILQSGHKVRLFSCRSGECKIYLSIKEAARWLVYINAFDDSALKPPKDNTKKQNKEERIEETNQEMAKDKVKSSPGLGWLGKLGVIFAVGNNLFETLLLNLTLLKDGQDCWEKPNKAILEKDTHELSVKERELYPLPENQAELLTWQSRRVLLERENTNRIKGYWIQSGDFFEEKNAFTEQMTKWKNSSKGKKSISYEPKRHEVNYQLWREFGSLFGQSDNDHIPGIVRWSQTLNRKLKRDIGDFCQFRIVSVQYGDKNATVKDTFTDSISFARDLLSDIEQESGKSWHKRIIEEIKKCEKLAVAIEVFSKQVAIAAGKAVEKSDGKKIPGRGKGGMDEKEEKGNEIYYRTIDLPFREWLYSIDPSTIGEVMENKVLEWQRVAKKTALILARKCVQEAGASAVIGREHKEKTYKSTKKTTKIIEKREYYSAARAMEVLVRTINALYPALR